MKPHEETLHVEGCGNPAHGPERSCWKVVNERGYRPIQGVTKDVATLYAAAPEMARAIMGPSGKGHHSYSPHRDEWSCVNCAHFAPSHATGCEFGDALKKAGIL